MSRRLRSISIVLFSGILTGLVMWFGWQKMDIGKSFDPRIARIESHRDSLRALPRYHESGDFYIEDVTLGLWIQLDDLHIAVILNPRDMDAQIRRVDLLYRLGLHEDAVVALDEAIELNSRRIELWLKKVDLMQRMGRRDDEITALNVVLRLEPKRTDLWLKKAGLCSNPARLPDCADAYEHVFRLEPENKQHRLDFALICHELGWINKSEEIYEGLHQRWPKDTTLWLSHAEKLGNREQWDDYVRVMDRMLAIFPDNVSLRMSKLQSVRLSGNLAEMEKESGEILRRDTSHHVLCMVYQYLEEGYDYRKKPDKAWEMCNRLIALDSTLIWVWERRGFLGHYVGKTLDEQLADFDKAIALNYAIDQGDPFGITDALQGKCQVLTEMGKIDEALTLADSIIGLKDDARKYIEAAGWGAKAYALKKTGRTEEALAAIENVINLTPDDDWAQRFQSRLLRQSRLQTQTTPAHSRTYKIGPNSEIFISGEYLDEAVLARVDSAWEAAKNAKGSDSTRAWHQFTRLFNSAGLPPDLDTMGRAAVLNMQPHTDEELMAKIDFLVMDGLLEEAERSLSDALVYSFNPLLRYERAKVRAQLGWRDKALADLSSAVYENPHYRYQARNDMGFLSLWKDSLFIGIVGER
ncbi:hypothetical protein EHM69_10400 [candidate division KSB1 bacterium]|nr:MAG: hypothetical protein EHM69_10400 [candidate division KSB1 bacterium]